MLSFRFLRLSFLVVLFNMQLIFNQCHCFAEVLREMVLTYQSECVQVIVPILTQAHMSFQESTLPGTVLTLTLLAYVLVEANPFPELVIFPDYAALNIPRYFLNLLYSIFTL